MKRLNSIQYSDGFFNLSMLLIRISFGGLLLVNHGMDKLMKFAELQGRFYSFLGLGSKASLILAIFAEVFCSLFIILGLFTRITVIPLIILMLVAIFGVHSNQPFPQAELAVVYGVAFLVLLFCGPGRISVDGMMKK